MNTVSESARHKLYESLEATLGPGSAGTLIELLPKYPADRLATRENITELRQALKETIDSKANALRVEMQAGFAHIELRFAEMETRFAQIDQRFADLDQRFAQIDQRFADVDQRFAQIDQRFADVDQRFAQMESCFAGVDSRFASLESQLARLHSRMWVLLVTNVAAMFGVGGVIAGAMKLFG